MGHVVRVNEREFRASCLISTIPVRTISELAGLSISGLDQLKSLNMTTLFCSTLGEPNFETIVLHNFHSEGVWKRLTLHSAYYGKAEGRHYFAVECTHLDDDGGAQSLFLDFARHARKIGLFSDDSRLEGSLTIKHAYPVYEKGFELILRQALHELKERGIESLGRQGRFDYIPSSTLAIERVRDALL